MAATYATIESVRKRAPYRAIDSTSRPSADDVQGWLDESQAELDATLQAAELPAPYTASAAMSILGRWITDYAEGRLRMAYAASGGDGSNDDGKDLVTRFEERLDDIGKRPGRYAAMLGAGAAPDTARRVRGHVLDNADGKTIEAGDFAPTFTTEELF